MSKEKQHRVRRGLEIQQVSLFGIPEREAEIGKRLREAREMLRLTQQEFGEQVGINRQRLASYEELRAPIRYDLALRICRHFILSEKWLATGDGLMRQCLDLASEPLSYRIPVDSPYGAVYDQFLSPIYERIRKEHGIDLRVNIGEGTNLEFLVNLFKYYQELWGKTIPSPLIPNFYAFLIDLGDVLARFVITNGRIPKEGEIELEAISQSPIKFKANSQRKTPLARTRPKK